MAAYFIDLVSGLWRFICIVIPLSFLGLFTGCSTFEALEQKTAYSVPSGSQEAVYDYREFGVPSQWDSAAVFVGQSKLKAGLLTDMRLLMQYGYSCRIFKITNSLAQTEYWLALVGFSDRREASVVMEEISYRGVWSDSLSLMSLPDENTAGHLASRLR